MKIAMVTTVPIVITILSYLDLAFGLTTIKMIMSNIREKIMKISETKEHLSSVLNIIL